jgi:hypothetical protein
MSNKNYYYGRIISGKIQTTKPNEAAIKIGLKPNNYIVVGLIPMKADITLPDGNKVKAILNSAGAVRSITIFENDKEWAEYYNMFTTAISTGTKVNVRKDNDGKETFDIDTQIPICGFWKSQQTGVYRLINSDGTIRKVVKKVGNTYKQEEATANKVVAFIREDHEDDVELTINSIIEKQVTPNLVEPPKANTNLDEESTE